MHYLSITSDTPSSDSRVHAGVWELAVDELVRVECLVSSIKQYQQMSSDAYKHVG